MISKFWSRAAIFLLALILLILGFAAMGVYWLTRPYKGYSEDSKIVEIPLGTHLLGIADLLQQQGIIEHPRTFLIALALKRRGAVIRAGEYNFIRPMSEWEVIQKLLKGEVHYHQVTIPEGANIFEIADILQKAGLCPREDFLAATQHVETIKDLAPNAVSLEGYLFPNTYKFEKGTTALEIAEKMVDQFRKFLTPDYLQAASRRKLSLNQAVILASLIEKETGQEQERPLISAVFQNRLRINQPLECDPTVIYAALVANRYRGTIYKSDMEMDSPFNTYVHSGLPIGPIANPGRPSLEAAVHPAAVDYLYFVSDNKGRHIFSRTLAEHQNAVRKYRRAVEQDNALAPKNSVGDKPAKKTPRASARKRVRR